MTNEFTINSENSNTFNKIDSKLLFKLDKNNTIHTYFGGFILSFSFIKKESK